MATEEEVKRAIDKANEEIIALATGKDRISKKTQFTKARNKLDMLLAKFDEFYPEKERKKEKGKLLKDINAKLKGKGLSVTQVLKGDPIATFELTHDVFGESMEPDYYWVLDFMREFLSFDVDKSADFFASSESSGYFGEMGGRRTAMESRIAGGGGAQGLFGTINMVIKSMINLLYDLKTFDVRLSHYKDLKDPKVKQTAMDALKGIWLNEVDKTKGNAAIDVLAAQLNFITLRDSFMIVPVHEWYKADADSKKISEIKDKAVENVKKMDLTDVVKRILGPRVKEFIDWLYLSEKELNMRYNVERSYLKAQNDALKVYTKWARPYLIAANKLMPIEYEDMLKKHTDLGLGSAATPSSFHSVQMYLELFGTKAAKIEVVKMPGYIKNELKLSPEREGAGDMPLTAIEVRMAFRGAPVTVVGARQERGYGFTGKKVFMFVGYVLQKKHNDLLKDFKEDEVLSFIDDMTKNSLDAMSNDLEKYMNEEKEEKKEEKKQFKFALPFPKFIKETFGSIKKFQVQAQGVYKSLPKSIRGSKDAWNIARLMLVAEENAKKGAFKVYDIFKKNHGMPTPP